MEVVFNSSARLGNRLKTFSRLFSVVGMAEKSTIFQGSRDHFNGVVIRSNEEPCDRPTMELLLNNSLLEWVANGIRGVWFEVDPNHSEWIPVLIQNGFSFHHSNPELCTLLKWLPKDDKCPVPPYAHTMVGVGAMVVNSNKEVLVVQEKWYKTPHWKLPGGYVDPGESLAVAAQREVLEETGIKAEFVSLISVRHMQPTEGGFRGTFGCSDFYFVAYLKSVNDNSNDIRMCTRELSAARWMPLEEYICHPLVHSNNQLLAKQLLAIVDPNDPALPIDCIKSAHPLTGAVQQIYLVGKEKFRMLDISKKNI